MVASEKNLLSGGCHRSSHPPRLKYWMPIHYDTIEDGQNKTSHLLFSFLLIVLFLHFIDVIHLSKLSLHHSIGVVWIIILLMKINVSIREIKTIACCLPRFVSTFAYSASCKTKCTRADLWAIICIYLAYCLVMDWRSFGQNQSIFVELLNHAHWIRMPNNT